MKLNGKFSFIILFTIFQAVILTLFSTINIGQIQRLKDYQNMEIKMTPLPKALFLLYLKHPEGIRFCDLPDYRDELLHIYASFSGRDSMDDIRASIDDLTNPLSNSINEKCSRIRQAFLSKFEDRLARNYYITGPRGEIKKILLPRELVTWEQ